MMEQEIKDKLLHLFGNHRGKNKADEIIQHLEIAHAIGGKKALVVVWEAVRKKYRELDLPHLNELPPPDGPKS